MAVVVFLSPKGGAGKTTSSLVLATQLARGASSVTVIDADPNRPLKAWASGDGPYPENLTIVSDVDEETILDQIEEASGRSPFVVVDLEGTAAKIALLAVSQADLVIVPTQGSQLDAEQAGRALRVIRQQEKAARRPVPFAVLLTRTNPTIRARTLAHIQRTLVESKIPVLETELNEREAFRAMFSFKRTLEQLNQAEVANLPKAIANAEAFTQEVIATLRAVKAGASTVEEVRA